MAAKNKKSMCVSCDVLGLGKSFLNYLFFNLLVDAIGLFGFNLNRNTTRSSLNFEPKWVVSLKLNRIKSEIQARFDSGQPDPKAHP